ncbi:MAG: amino acid ABC transporter permease [Clostridia bacterium]|nr:amino acid ABC transporter permease [Clostridia bacterium]
MISKAGFLKTFRFWRMFVDGFVCTISLSALTVVFGFILALILAVARLSNFRPLKGLGIAADGSQRTDLVGKISMFNPLAFLATCYVEIFRATPMLVQLFVVYYILMAPFNIPRFMLFGTIRFERFVPGVVALSLNSAAYLSEIIRSGIQSIDGGQTEAARSLGLSQFQTMKLIILPQAIKNILPAIANEFVTIIKESSITYTIGVQEIMYAVNSVKGATFSIAEPLVISAVIYFCLTFPTSKIIAHFERKMGAGSSRNSSVAMSHERKAKRGGRI